MPVNLLFVIDADGNKHSNFMILGDKRSTKNIIQLISNKI